MKTFTYFFMLKMIVFLIYINFFNTFANVKTIFNRNNYIITKLLKHSKMEMPRRESGHFLHIIPVLLTPSYILNNSDTHWLSVKVDFTGKP